LRGEREVQTEFRAVAEQALEQWLILRGGDHKNVANAREHQHRQRIIDHRLVEHRQQLL
jgi:hypothetical protein